MKKQSLIYIFLTVLFLACFPKDGITQSANAPKNTALSTQPDEDLATKIEKAADATDEKIDRFSSQLGRIIDTLEKRYDRIAPKIEQIRAFIQKKIEDRKEKNALKASQK